MPTNSTKRIDNLTYEISLDNFNVVSDVAENSGGANKGPSPHDYIEIALAACSAITVQMYANRKKYDLKNVDVKVKVISEGAKNEILREIKFEGELSSEEKELLLTIAGKCPVHKLLSAGASIETRLIS